VFLSNQYGVQRAYGLLNQENADGVSLDELSDLSNLTTLDIPFAQFIKDNIGSIDSNGDNNITQDELNNMMSTMQNQGYTYNQLLSMSIGTSSTNQSLLETVLADFDKIDSNKDGKVSQAEIDIYNLDKEIEDKKTELSEVKASTFSVFYSDSTSDTDTETTESSTDSDS